MTGHNYPDDLYADALNGIRKMTQPTGAYRAEPEMPESERKLRTALAYVNHARDLITEALKLPKGVEDEVSARATLVTIQAHHPKWDVRWLEQQTARNLPPNCDGLSARDVRAPHPMAAETIRDHDERLSGPEDEL